MSKKILLVELPERPEQTKDPYGRGYIDCLDTLQSKSVKVDVGKLTKILINSIESMITLNTKKECKDVAIEIKTSLESGELWEEGK